MDFPATEIFVEIFVVGVLLVFGVSPILICFSPSARQRQGLLPIGDWKDWKPGLLLTVALLYSVGIAGNRLVERLYSRLQVGGIDATMDSDKMELAVREHSEMARDWVERHKTYLKVLRAASFSSLLFLLSMPVYSIFNKRRTDVPRYGPKHYMAAILLGILFFCAFVSETHHYRRLLSDYHQIPKAGP